MEQVKLFAKVTEQGKEPELQLQSLNYDGRPMGTCTPTPEALRSLADAVAACGLPDEAEGLRLLVDKRDKARVGRRDRLVAELGTAQAAVLEAAEQSPASWAAQA